MPDPKTLAETRESRQRAHKLAEFRAARDAEIEQITAICDAIAAEARQIGRGLYIEGVSDRKLDKLTAQLDWSQSHLANLAEDIQNIEKGDEE